jgi:hypothetical protein
MFFFNLFILVGAFGAQRIGKGSEGLREILPLGHFVHQKSHMT